MANTGDPLTAWQWNVPGLTLTTPGQNTFEYKLPYTIQNVGCCTRISPKLMCCDKTCFKSMQGGGGLPFLDMVNMDDGHQFRYRTKKAQCSTPRILAFQDGQSIGWVGRTMRCGNGCLTCWEDCQGKDVLQVGLHDENDNQIARIDRSGKGCCWDCNCQFPMKCVGCCFVCATTTCACYPGNDPPCYDNGCDPVCCACCVRGSKQLCGCYDTPVLQCGCCAPQCTVPCCSWENVPMDYTNTVRYENFEVVSSGNKERVGDLQFLYRGNIASQYAWSNKPYGNPLKGGFVDMPLKVTGFTSDSKVGKLMSAVAAGRSYLIGEPKPMFSDIAPKGDGKSPGFSGWVDANNSKEVQAMLDVMNEDLVVLQDMVLHADKGMKAGHQVKGWKLIMLGYTGHKNRKPRGMESLQAVKDAHASATEGALGDYSSVFQMRFQLPDSEKPVVRGSMGVVGDSAGMAGGFNPPKGGYGNDMMEEVHCACIMKTLWSSHGGATTKDDKKVLCTMPCYAKVVESKISPGTPGSASVPVQVVMGFNKAGEAMGLKNAKASSGGGFTSVTPVQAIAVTR